MEASPMYHNYRQYHSIHKRSPSPTFVIRGNIAKPALLAGAAIGAGAGLVAASAIPAGTLTLGTLSLGR